MKIDVLVAGQIATPHAYVFRPPGEGRLGRISAVRSGRGGTLQIPVLSFVLHHPSAGPILVDTGLHPDAVANPSGDYGRFLGRLFSGLRPGGASFVDQLAARGIDRGAIRTVVMTHLHVDHTGGMRLLENAEFICTAREWRSARKPRPFLRGYAAHHLPGEERMRLIEIDRDGVPFGPFARTIDLLEDGSIRLISTPGHTAGHCSVLVRLGGGRDALLVGDAAYTLRNIRELILPAFTAGDERSLASLRALRQFAEQNPEAVLVPSHDPGAWRELDVREAASAE